MKKKIIIVVVALIMAFVGFVGFMFSGMIKQMNNSDPTYWTDDIQKILDRYDSIPDVDIVFIGSSSIRKWESLEADFKGYSVVNHGFGGSKIADSTYFYDQLITPFKPEAIVIFSGTNNIHGMTKSSQTGEEVFEFFKGFYTKSINTMPNVPVFFISISPTKARFKVWEEADKANKLIKEYAKENSMLTFIDTTEALLKNGKPNEDLLQKDGLHLNQKGYAIWTSIINPIVTETVK